MAAQILTLPVGKPAHDGLVWSATAQSAAYSWMMLKHARIALSRGQTVDAADCLTCLSAVALVGRGPVASRIRRDLPGLAGALAVTRALASPPALGATPEAVSA